MTTPALLAFDDHREDGAFTVHAPEGPVARIEVGFWSGRSFQATTPQGEPLCLGRTRGFFSSWWDAVDGAGAPVASLKRGLWATRSVVEVAGRSMTLEGTWSGREWQLLDEERRPVLSTVTTTGFFTLRPHSWEVRLDQPLTLAQVVAVVQLFRLSQKARAAAAAS